MKAVLYIILIFTISFFAFNVRGESQLLDTEQVGKLNFTENPPVTDKLTIGGAVRVNYSYKEYDEQSKETLGHLDFELFRLNIIGELGKFKLFAQYRWYSDFSFPEYAYMSYDLSEYSEVQLGLNKVPFGILPYSSFGYWESILYHIGLEDDNDVGVKYSYSDQQWDIDFGFYKNSELNSANHARYSFDVIVDDTNEFNQEANQFNVRIQKNFGDISIGLSAQFGDLYNIKTLDTGTHSAYAFHFTSSYQNWHYQLEIGSYSHSPKNPQGQDENKILFGAYDSAFYVASVADFYLFNMSRNIVMASSAIDKMSCYNNFGLIKPKHRSEGVGNKTLQNLLGCSISSGAITTYIELISGENSSFVNGPGVGLVGDKNWSHRVNINIGYYF